MPDFWKHCGYHLLSRDSAGRLVVTDDFLRAYLTRPELALVPESCANERSLHEALMEEPRREVSEREIEAIADEDARENYRVFLRFRSRLLAAPTLEACYLAIFGEADVSVPLLFVRQLTQVILRNILRGTADALQARAAELFFRPQKIHLQEGRAMAADLETVQLHATTGGFGSLGELLVQSRTPVRTIELDVLTEETASVYWDRDERFDTVLPLGPSQPGSLALARVMEHWIEHFHGVRVKIRPLARIEDDRWTWHVGLDAEASGILNDLYQGREVAVERLERLICLFKLVFENPADMLAPVAGRPVYLGLAMDVNQVLRMKPQNLLVNLPLARRV
ncbi:DUF6352 family protein [Pelomicrobium methylotrophicum]|uniref:Uncharacterized protein n=1 Tax=Pelomicrobium methylotrophicum TaxID=2602750 RepID=A0A5C7EUE6_9PROT|nr:DUF6352 family protein [Pelomicrobium methylotrophicum]TXF12370.1 hypothetical protein FR698_05785 [Pelomicrobium methylotrophicum]